MASVPFPLLLLLADAVLVVAVVADAEVVASYATATAVLFYVFCVLRAHPSQYVAGRRYVNSPMRD